MRGKLSRDVLGSADAAGSKREAAIAVAAVAADRANNSLRCMAALLLETPYIRPRGCFGLEPRNR